MSELSDDLIKLIYGDDIDIDNVREVKSTKDIYDDIILYLSKSDITKLKEIKKLPFKEVFNVLESEIKTKRLIRKNIKINKVGFEIPINKTDTYGNFIK